MLKIPLLIYDKVLRYCSSPLGNSNKPLSHPLLWKSFGRLDRMDLLRMAEIDDKKAIDLEWETISIITKNKIKPLLNFLYKRISQTPTKLEFIALFHKIPPKIFLNFTTEEKKDLLIFTILEYLLMNKKEELEKRKKEGGKEKEEGGFLIDIFLYSKEQGDVSESERNEFLKVLKEMEEKEYIRKVAIPLQFTVEEIDKIKEELQKKGLSSDKIEEVIKDRQSAERIKRLSQFEIREAEKKMLVVDYKYVITDIGEEFYNSNKAEMMRQIKATIGNITLKSGIYRISKT